MKYLNNQDKDILEDFKEYYFANKKKLENSDLIKKKIHNLSLFEKEYPITTLKNLKLEDYIVGDNNNNNTLCYKLVYGTYKECGPGIGGGSANKYGIYYSNSKNSYMYFNNIENYPTKRWESLKENIIKIIESVKNAKNANELNNIGELKGMSMLLVKLAFCYYPYKILCICGKKQLHSVLNLFKIKYNENDSQIKMAFLINSKLRTEIPELQNEDPTILGHQVWNYYTEKINNKLEKNQDKRKIEKDNRYSYNKNKMLEDTFLTEEQYENIINTLARKKNIVLQGVPGVGKTFYAKKIMYSLMNEKNDERIAMVQFHQSYSYEDFIQGYRPNKNGKFELKDGIFYKMVKKACKELENAKRNGTVPQKYCIIIDEINRGNLSRIFGELLMLIEPDKRSKEYGTYLTYNYNDELFYVPENLYIIGTMNTADRSLTMVDRALRRRFAFIELEPAFENQKFKEYLLKKENLNEKIVNKIITKFIKLNKFIEDTLGNNFLIGHSYFIGQDLNNKNFEKVYKDIINYEIIPLLEEYYYDDNNKIEQALEIIKL